MKILNDHKSEPCSSLFLHSATKNSEKHIFSWNGRKYFVSLQLKKVLFYVKVTKYENKGD